MRYGFKDIVIDSRTGLNPRKNFVLGSGDNNYITIKDIYNGQVNITDKTDKVDDDAIQIIKKRSRIKVGDILFVSIGRIGETAIVTSKDDTWDVNESVFVFTINREIITPEYFCMLFRSDSVKNYLTGNSSGSTFKSIKMNQLEKMVFDLPPLKLQEEITAKLSKVKVIYNLRVSELTYLDNLIKARFVELFGGGEYQTEKLGKICSKITDGTHKTPTYLQNGVTFISAKNIIHGELDFSDVKYISEDEYKEIQKRCQTERLDILLSKSGSLGSPVIVRTEEKLGLFESLAVLKYDRKRILPEFLCEQLKTDRIQRQFTAGTKGVAIKHLHLGVIADTDIVVPPIEEQKSFANFVAQVDKSKVAVQKALDEAQLLFDSLMQQYFG